MEHQKTFKLDKSLMTDKIKNEAKKRMELLQLSQRVIDEFINNGNIMMSDFDGQIVDLDSEAIRGIEKTISRGYVPYHVLKYYIPDYGLYTRDVFYISSYEEEWDFERPTGQYAFIASFGEFDESGSIVYLASDRYEGVKRIG